MRKLIVKRKKQFVASAMKVRICIETKSEGDIKLSNANLKILGELKNGQTLEVEMPEDAVDVYVVYDKHFPERFHSKWHLEAGEDEVVLHTFSRFSPFSGNPFAIGPNKELSKSDKERLKSEEKTNKEKSPGYKILMWVIIIVFGILGFILGSSLV